MKTIIKNGWVCIPEEPELKKKDIFIQDGLISEIGSFENPEEADVHLIDAEGLWVFPGGIDPHVHLNDPGFTDREDFYHGTCAAAKGGITTIIDMPCTSVPPVTELKHLKVKLEAVQQRAVVDFGFFGGVSSQSFQSFIETDAFELAPEVMGFKAYYLSGMPSFERLLPEQLEAVLESAKMLSRPVLLHAEDYDYVTEKTEEYSKMENSPFFYYKSRDERAESLAVAEAAELAQKVKGDLHIVHLGTCAPEKHFDNVHVTCETCPHYLAFDVNDFEELKSVLKVNPPVKSPPNKVRLWRMLQNGTALFVSSDHAPCREQDKYTGSIWTDYSGIPGLETLYPFMVSEGLIEGRLSLTRFSEVTSSNAAKRYGFFDRKGSIEPGKHADITIVNPDDTTVVNGLQFYSKGKVTPFENYEFKGCIEYTMVRGQVVYQKGKGIVADKGSGKFVRPAH